MPCLLNVTLELLACAVNITPSPNGSGTGAEPVTFEVLLISVTLFQKSITPLAGSLCISRLSCASRIVIPIAVVNSVASAIFWLTQDCLRISFDGSL